MLVELRLQIGSPVLDAGAQMQTQHHHTGEQQGDAGRQQQLREQGPPLPRCNPRSHGVVVPRGRK